MSKGANIRQVLPYGAIKRVSEKLRIPYVTVNAVIDGKVKNKEVLIALGEEVAAAKKEEKAYQKLREKLVA
jgi:prefoldin subunit 5